MVHRNAERHPVTDDDTIRHLIQTRHGAMHVRVTGEQDDAPPLVLLHMSPLSGRMFDRVVPLLARGRQVVVPDRLGFGYSDRLAERMPLSEYALATLDAFDAIGVRQFDVVGIHTGSTEAVELATAHADRIRRVGIVAIPVFTEAELAAFKGHYFEPPEPAADGSHLTWVWEWWREHQQKQPGWTIELMHDRAVDHMDSWPFFWWTYHSVFDYPIADRLARVEQPFLVLAPHDDLWPQTQNGRQYLPEHAQFLELPHLALEIFNVATEKVAGCVEEFLA